MGRGGPLFVLGALGGLLRGPLRGALGGALRSLQGSSPFVCLGGPLQPNGRMPQQGVEVALHNEVEFVVLQQQNTNSRKHIKSSSKQQQSNSCKRACNQKQKKYN